MQRPTHHANYKEEQTNKQKTSKTNNFSLQEYKS